MPETNTVARSLHDTGLAAWFGGSLMGAIGVNGAAARVAQVDQRAKVASAGWASWAPVNAAAIASHLIGGALVVGANKGRIASQRGVAGWTTGKTALTVAALAATAWSGLLGRRIAAAGEVPAEGGTDPAPTTPPEVANAQRQLKALQWVIPALTGSLLVVNARMGEQQRPKEVLSGMARRLLPGGN
jgi:hypothetical protein